MANRNRSSLRTEVYTRLAESGTGFYTDAQINQWLNDGVRDLSVTVEPLETSATVTTVTGTREYRLPTDYLSIKAVQFLDAADAWYNLTETTWQKLFRDEPDWQNETSAQPTQWYWRQNVVGVRPAPSADYSGADSLRILYTYIPAAMDSDSSTTGLDEWLDDAVILYGVYRAYLKDRDFQRASATAQEYGRAVSEAGIKLNRHRKEHAPHLEVDQSGYRLHYQRNSRRTRIWSSGS
jgi:hypothetical protein